MTGKAVRDDGEQQAAELNDRLNDALGDGLVDAIDEKLAKMRGLDWGSANYPAEDANLFARAGYEPGMMVDTGAASLLGGLSGTEFNSSMRDELTGTYSGENGLPTIPIRRGNDSGQISSQGFDAGSLEDSEFNARVLRDGLPTLNRVPIEEVVVTAVRQPGDVGYVGPKATGSDFKLMKGAYGSARDYGDKIVVNDLSGFYERNKTGIYVASQGNALECYNVAKGLGLPVTSNIGLGIHFEKGMVFEKGTLIVFASDLKNGGKGYASNNPNYPNYAPGKSSHFAIVSEDFTYDGTKIPVLHQYNGSGGLKFGEIKNHPERSQNKAINNLDNAYVLKLKRE